MKTPKPTYKDLEAKIKRQDATINNYSNRISDLNEETIALQDAGLKKDCELLKRVHGLTALAFATLAFAVGIVVGSNIKSRSQDNASIDGQMEFVATNNTIVEIYDSQTIYPMVELDFKPGRFTNTVEHVPVCPVAVKKTYRSPYVKKGAELLSP